MIFNLPPICGLFPLLLYIVLAFKKGMHPLVNVSICAVVGAIMVKQPLNGLGAVIYESMGSFLALVGFIIMLGSGLGMVLRKTGVAAAIVNVLMRKIGVRTQKRAMIATMVCSVVLVTLLGKVMGLYRDRLLAVHYSVGVQANGGHHSLRAGRHLPGRRSDRTVPQPLLPAYGDPDEHHRALLSPPFAVCGTARIHRHVGGHLPHRQQSPEGDPGDGELRP
mgnify:CR=1 FL=1